MGTLISEVMSALVNFAPNAYGEVSQAGGYASNLQYHPNGSIQWTSPGIVSTIPED